MQRIPTPWFDSWQTARRQDQSLVRSADELQNEFGDGALEEIERRLLDDRRLGGRLQLYRIRDELSRRRSLPGEPSSFVGDRSDDIGQSAQS